MAATGASTSGIRRRPHPQWQAFHLTSPPSTCLARDPAYAERMDILFVATVALITSDATKTRDLLVGSLGLPLAGQAAGDAYVFSDKIGGCKHFALWPLGQAAQACFGRPEWPGSLPAPQVSIEFEVKDEQAVATAEKELRARGHQLLHAARKEPWGQTVCRLLSSEGAIIGISYAPSLHSEGRARAH
jgi:catechol 2,3-dioxygenase-like lactoylglutathione lyase family enzyme